MTLTMAVRPSRLLEPQATPRSAAPQPPPAANTVPAPLRSPETIRQGGVAARAPAPGANGSLPNARVLSPHDLHAQLDARGRAAPNHGRRDDASAGAALGAAAEQAVWGPVQIHYDGQRLQQGLLQSQAETQMLAPQIMADGMLAMVKHGFDAYGQAMMIGPQILGDGLVAAVEGGGSFVYRFFFRPLEYIYDPKRPAGFRSKLLGRLQSAYYRRSPQAAAKAAVRLQAEIERLQDPFGHRAIGQQIDRVRASLLADPSSGPSNDTQ